MLNIELEIEVSDNTVRRVLSSSKWITFKPQVVPSLTSDHMVRFPAKFYYQERRLAWCRDHEHDTFGGKDTMVVDIDEKYFEAWRGRIRCSEI